MRPEELVTVYRRGRPIKVHPQVLRWQARRRKEERIRRKRSKALQAILSAFKGDQVGASLWIKNTVVPQYKLSVEVLLKRGKTKCLEPLIRALHTKVE